MVRRKLGSFTANGVNMANINSILVVGGGIAGLTTAAALKRHDLPVELVERQNTWCAPGAGFLVHANGVRMLTSLGLGSGVEAAGAVIRRWHFCDQQGNLLSETDLEALWGDAGPCVGIERPELQRVLLPGVVDLRCRLGTSVTTLVQDDAHVRVGFSDGSTGHYDLVIGADGMKSTVRDLILGARSPSELGAMTWRSISRTSSIPGPTAIQFHLGDGCLFGFMAIGRGRTYGFNYVITQRFRDPLEGRLERLRHRLRNFGPRVQEYLDALERDDQVICSTMMWMEIKEWHAGRVVLVGDAAHASSPMMGQGGCMAMEDAGVLAEELRSAATVEDALASYVRRRKPRVEWVQRQSIGLANLLTASSAARNAMLRERGTQLLQDRFGPLVPPP
jgi:2-polyprenyl-6-methoxyphenol hydroxylase-like FAD-dependent oxidoreductase